MWVSALQTMKCFFVVTNILSTTIVEGRFAPLFGEDENLWVVEELLSFSDFDSFVKRMRKNIGTRRK